MEPTGIACRILEEVVSATEPEPPGEALAVVEGVAAGGVHERVGGCLEVCPCGHVRGRGVEAALSFDAPRAEDLPARRVELLANVVEEEVEVGDDDVVIALKCKPGLEM